MINVAVLEPEMAKKTPGDKYVAPTENVRLPRDLVDMARVVVANRKAGGNRLKLADYIEAMIRDQITKDYDEVTPSKKKPRGES